MTKTCLSVRFIFFFASNQILYKCTLFYFTDKFKFILLFIAIILLGYIECLFTHHNNVINLKPNQVYSLNYRSPHTSKKYSALDIFKAPIGYRIYADCKIFFYQKGSGSCYRDHFYIGYRDDGTLKGAKFYCGRKTVHGRSKRTSGIPILAIASTGMKHAVRGEYNCKVYTKQMPGSNVNGYNVDNGGSNVPPQQWINREGNGNGHKTGKGGSNSPNQQEINGEENENGYNVDNSDSQNQEQINREEKVNGHNSDSGESNLPSEHQEINREENGEKGDIDENSNGDENLENSGSDDYDDEAK